MDVSFPNTTNMSDHNSSIFGSSYSPETQSDYGTNQPDPTFMPSGYSTQSSHHEVTEVINSSGSSNQDAIIVNSRNGGSSRRKEPIEIVAFKIKSEVEILDDGFKWRKYGKKMVRNSPNPRNYYKCSVEGCSVKKRVERDDEDQRYVITTYVGIHNHQGHGAQTASILPEFQMF